MPLCAKRIRLPYAISSHFGHVERPRFEGRMFLLSYYTNQIWGTVRSNCLRFLVRKGWALISHSERSSPCLEPLTSACHWGGGREIHTNMFRSDPAWYLHHDPISNTSQELTLWNVTDSWHSGKPSTTGELLDAPTMGSKRTRPCTMQEDRGVHGFRGRLVDYIAAVTRPRGRQIARMHVLPVFRTRHYVGVREYGRAPHLDLHIGAVRRVHSTFHTSLKSRRKRETAPRR
jgi:hypothetical protein